MGGRDEGVGRGDDFAGDAQCLQRGDQGQGAIGKQRDVFHPEVIGQFLLQLLMKGAAVGQALAVPDLLQVGNELLQRWQQRAGDGNGFGHGNGCS
ncbi:hypothetical protein D3C78_1838310 [compost metagenome]